MEQNPSHLDYGACHLLKADRHLQRDFVYQAAKVVTSVLKRGPPLYGIDYWDFCWEYTETGHPNVSKIFRGSFNTFLLFEKENLGCKPHVSRKGKAVPACVSSDLYFLTIER